MRRSSHSFLLTGVLAFASIGWAEDGGTSAEAHERLPRIDELVPGLTTEVPSLDEVTQTPEQPYPNAGDILRAMREIPPLERSREETVPAPAADLDAGAE